MDTTIDKIDCWIRNDDGIRGKTIRQWIAGQIASDGPIFTTLPLLASILAKQPYGKGYKDCQKCVPPRKPLTVDRRTQSASQARLDYCLANTQTCRVRIDAQRAVRVVEASTCGRGMYAIADV